MLEIIYNILGLVIVILAVVYLIFAIIAMIKKTFNDNIGVIETRIAFTSVFFTLFIIHMIMALILGICISIVSDFICAILWFICTGTGWSDLIKATKRTTNYDFDIRPDFRDINDDNIIDVEFKEITDEDNN